MVKTTITTCHLIAPVTRNVTQCLCTNPILSNSIFRFTTTNMDYSACFTIDVNMFWIFILFCFFPCSHKQLCLIKFVIFCTNGSSLFRFPLRNKYSTLLWWSKKQKQVVNFQSITWPVLLGWDGGQVDVNLHRGQRFDLASCPASLPLPQATRGANAEPAVTPSFANDPFVVVDVGHASHCYHAGFQHLCRDSNSQFRGRAQF